MGDRDININIGSTPNSSSSPKNTPNNSQIDLKNIEKAIERSLIKGLDGMSSTISKVLESSLAKTVSKHTGQKLPKIDIDSSELSKSIIAGLKKDIVAAVTTSNSSGSSIDANNLSKAISSSIEKTLSKSIGTKVTSGGKELNFKPIADAITKAIKDSSGGNIDSLGKAINNLISTVGSLTNTIKTTKDKGTPTSIKDIQDLTQTARKLKDDFTSLSKDLKDIKQALGSMASTAGDFTKAAVDFSTKTRAAAREDIKQVAGMSPKELATALQSVLDKASKTNTAKDSGLDKQVEALSKNIKTIEDVLSKFGKVLDNMKAAGIDTSSIRSSANKVLKIADTTAEVDVSVSKRSKVGIKKELSTLIQDPVTVEAELDTKTAEARLEYLEKKIKKIKGQLNTEISIGISEKEFNNYINVLNDFANEYRKILSQLELPSRIELKVTAPKEFTSKSSTTRDVDAILNSIDKHIKGVISERTKEINKAKGTGRDTSSSERDLHEFKQAYREADVAKLKKFAYAKMSYDNASSSSKVLDSLKTSLVELESAVGGGDKLKQALGGLHKAATSAEDSTSGLANSMTGAEKKAKQVDDSLGKLADTLDDAIFSVKRTSESFDKVSRTADAHVKYGDVGSLRSIKKTHQVGAFASGTLGIYGTESYTNLRTQTKAPDVSKEVDAMASSIVRSLNDLKQDIINDLNENLKKGWKVTSDKFDTVGSNPREARQWSIKIANVSALKNKGFEGPDALDKAINNLIETNLSKRKTVQSGVASDVASWVKNRNSFDISNTKDLSDVIKKELLKIKDKHKDSTTVSSSMVRELEALPDIEGIYRKTYGLESAKRNLTKDKIMREIAIPAAHLTPTGTAVFKTAHGSNRALAKFANYSSGFEEVHKKLAPNMSKDSARKLGESVVAVSKEPHGTMANDLAKSMVSGLYSLDDTKDKSKLASRYKQAAVMKKSLLKKDLKPSELNKVLEATMDEVARSFSSAIAKGLNGDTLVDYMTETVGVSARDVIKSYDKVEFKNVYDVYKDVLKAPLKKLAEKPDYTSNVRSFESATRQVEQLMPIIETGRVRRGRHQQNVVHLAANTSAPFSDTGPLLPEDQKNLIKELNIRLHEMTQELAVLDKLGATEDPTIVARRRNIDVPKGIKTLSSLGLPDAQAGRYARYDKGVASREDDEYSEGINHLKAIKGDIIKVYSDNLRAMAPFGEQFQQTGRNISNVTTAMTSDSGDIRYWQDKFGGQPIKGVTSEFPSLRTSREAELIKSGAYGDKGYGFNVVTELRHTANTFEDQILVSGKMADALTSVVRTLVTPSSGGKAGTRNQAVGDIKSGLVKDVDSNIRDAIRDYQEIFKDNTKYEGRAEKAFIDDVKKMMLVVKGESVEVQVAKLAEVFVNHFGRKLTTRYGSKGVSVTPSVDDPNEFKDVLAKYYGSVKGGVKILPSGERGKAGLGTAMMPKSMGEIASEIIDINMSKLEAAGHKESNLKALKTKLTKSGNKFILDSFKDLGEGLVADPEEITKAKATFTEFSKVLADVGESLPTDDLKAVGKLKEIYSKAGGQELYKETPVDVRISSYGLSKRGLQTEIMELIMNNIVGSIDSPTTMPEELRKEVYEKLLPGGASGKSPGLMSEISKSLGYTGTGKSRSELKSDLERIFTAGIDPNKKPEKYKEAQSMAARAAELESLSNFYVDTIDELGKQRKSLVGSKFLQVIQEPGQNPAWSKDQITSGTKGLKLNLPAFAAYETTFGKDSAMMKEIISNSDLKDKESLEYIKALQAGLGDNQAVKEQIFRTAKEISLEEIASFSGATGSFSGLSVDDLRGTILDAEKFPSAMKLSLPGSKDPFYVPNALARGTYKDAFVAGEEGPSEISRHLQNIINTAKEVSEIQQALVSGKGVATEEALMQLPKTFNVKVGDALKGNRQEFFDKVIASIDDPRKEALVAERDKLVGAAGGDPAKIKDAYYQLFRGAPSKLSTGYNLSDLVVGGTKNIKEEDSVFGRAVSSGNVMSLQPVSDAAGVVADSERMLGRKLEELEANKMKYYKALAETVSGKKGAVSNTFFSKKIPAVMAKAVAASVDKTEELKNFSSDLTSIAKDFGSLDPTLGISSLLDNIDTINSIGLEHASNVDKYKRSGLPVLKQHELGIPVDMAKKLKAPFDKYNIKDQKSAEDINSMGNNTLYDLIKYTERLSDYARTESPDEKEAIKHYIDEYLNPYVESIRFPFTGTSSIQPYKAKILSSKSGIANDVLAVPGMPELDFDKLDPIINQIKDMRDKAVAAREIAQGVDGSPVDSDKAARLTDLINRLNKAISDVIPKYIAHQQKLDFDGDEIEVHTATTYEARKNIRDHFNALTRDVSSTASVFRTEFTADAKQPSQGDYPLAFSLKSSEKKFPHEKGYDFLRKPFLTKDVEYLDTAKKLEIMADRASDIKGQASVSDILEDVSRDTLVKKKDKNALHESVLSKLSGGTDNIAKDAKKAAEAISLLDDELRELVEHGITKQTFESKYKDAVEAQLFKIHTGQETEALTRLQRLFEPKIGMSKQDGLSGFYNQERHTQMNELVRYGIQKGLDVKHAGERTVSSEIQSMLSSYNGATELVDKIKGADSKSPYKGLQEFADINKKALEMQLGAKSTEELRGMAKELYSMRGEQTELVPSSRSNVINALTDRLGFYGFIEDLHKEIKDAVRKGVVMDPETPAKARGRSIEQYIKDEVMNPAKAKYNIINKYVTKQQDPVYGFTRTTDLDSFKEKYSVKTPSEYELFGAKKDEIKSNYERSKAVALALEDALSKTSTDTRSGAYTDAILSTINNIKVDKDKVDILLSKIVDRPSEMDSTVGGIFDRLTNDKLSTGYKNAIGNKDLIQDLSDIVGVAPARSDIFTSIEQDLSQAFRDKAESIGITGEDVDKYVDEKISQSKAVYQLDKIIRTAELISKGDFTTLFKKYDPVAEQRVAAGLSGPDERDRKARAQRFASDSLADLLTPPAGVGGSGTPITPGGGQGISGPGGPGGPVPFYYDGDKPIPVHIASIAENLSFVQLKEKVSQASLGSEPVGPSEFKPEYDIDKLRRWSKDLSGGINELEDTTFKDIYRASALHGGGVYGQKGFSDEDQIKAIMKSMTGDKVDTNLLDSSAILGTALHEKIERQYKQQNPNAEFEKLIKYRDEKIGDITGHIDILEKTDTGTPTKAIDIKTATSKFNKRLQEIISKIGSDSFEDIISYIEKSGNQYDIKTVRYKLEEAASQLNLYIHAMEQAGESIEAEAQFFDRKDIDNLVKVKVVKDPGRLKRDISNIAEARKRIGEDGSLYAKTGSYEALKKAHEDGRSEFTEYSLDLMLKQAESYYDDVIGGKYGDINDPAIGQKGSKVSRKGKSVKVHRSDMDDFINMEKEGRARMEAEAKAKTGLDAYSIPPKIHYGEGYDSVAANLKELHKQALLYQSSKGLDFKSELEKLKAGGGGPEGTEGVHDMIVSAAKEGPNYQEFIDLTKKLRDIRESGAGKGMTGVELLNAWKMYRIALGEFYLDKIETAKKDLESAESVKGVGNATVEFAKYTRSIKQMQEYITRNVGKRTDIYADDKRYVSPNLAEAAGVYLTPAQIQRKSSGPIGDDDKLMELFKYATEDLSGEANVPLTPPVEKAKHILGSLTDMNQEMVNMMLDAEKLRRLGPEVIEAWDFTGAVEKVSRLRSALEKFRQFNVTDDYTANEQKNLELLIKYLKNVENSFTPLDTTVSTKGDLNSWGATGTVPVPKWMDPQQQLALHTRNVEKLKQYYAKTTDEGGPALGERMSYTTKVLDQSGNILKNTITDFYKYGETVNEAGEKTGVFNLKSRDLISSMQGIDRGFRGAIVRAIKWGSASTVVYGGMAKLREAIGTLSDIEYGIAQIRMVLVGTDEDFDKLTKAAVGFSKTYGTSLVGVLDSMRIFAQQGLNQAEIIDRTRTAALAANVTTLEAKDATEALTAAMRIFGSEGESSMRFMDAWSEVEAKNAVTAGDLAKAIMKSASAAKTAGISFDQLNGIVAAIGSTTRQTGTEIGTSMRFIARRLSTEKGPEALAKLGISTLGDTGDLRPGFDVLGDLAAQWDDLTNSQKLNVAQAIGGTRQYNSLIAMMDQWQLVLKATAESINSKGSAERRNTEVMSTYKKQLEQVKATAVELQMSIGKAVLPAFKFGLGTVKTLLESINAIPNTFKAIGAGAILLFGYLAKGRDLIDKIFDVSAGGKSIFGGLGESLSREFSAAKYEIFGRGTGADVLGLKTITSKKTKDEELLPQGKKLADFHSSLGKSLFLVKHLGDSYNKFVGEALKGNETRFKNIGDPIAKFGEKIKKAGIGAELFSVFSPTMFDDAIAIGAAAAGKTTEFVGNLSKKVSEMFGTAAGKWTETFLNENRGLVASIAPLAVTVGTVGMGLKSAIGHYKTLLQSSQDYEKSVYNTRANQNDELSSVRSLIISYDKIESKLKSINEAHDPKVKARRQELGTYESPLLGMAKIQKEVIDLSNQLAESNYGLIVGYDKLGNAIISTSNNFKDLLTTLEKSKITQIANTEVGIAAKHIEALTTTEGPEKWKYELKSLLKEAPLFGEMMAKGIAVSPAKSMEVLTSRLNSIIAEKNKNPLTTAFDSSIKKYQEQLKTVKTGFEGTYSDFRRVLADISTKGLSQDEITKIFSSDKLKKGYQLMIDVEPKFNLKETKGKASWQDVLGAEVMKRAFPANGNIDAIKELTKANIESLGIKPRQGVVRNNDIALFMDDAADKYNMAGNQAIIKLKETTDGVFEWVATYFNTKTLKIEERSFDSNMQAIVETILPYQSIKEDLSERIEALNEFVAGAGAGLRGISPKDFKKDFNLGERFFSDISTTTLIQSTKGFNPTNKSFGQSEFQTSWDKDFKEYYVKPMNEYRNIMEQLDKFKLEGLENADINMATGLYEEIVKLQDELKNNQVVLQYRAVFADLTKTIEQGNRTLEENVTLEARRLSLMQETSGYLKGVNKDLANVDLGSQKYSELNPRQRAMVGNSEFRGVLEKIRELEIRKAGTADSIYSVDKASVALNSVRDVAKGFGSVLSKEDMRNFVEVVAKTGDTGVAELKIETSKVVDNTAQTVTTLESILNAIAGEGNNYDRLESLVKNSETPRDIANALESVAVIRNRAVKNEDFQLSADANKALNDLTGKLVSQVGLKEAYNMVDVFNPFKKFKPEELLQRSAGGMSFDDFVGNLRYNLPDEKKWFGLKTVKGNPTFEKDLAEIYKLQSDNNKESLISSKDAIKAAVASSIYTAFNKNYTNKNIQSIDSNIAELNKNLGNTQDEGEQTKIRQEIADLASKREAENKKLQVYGAVQNMSAIGGTAAQLSKTMGMSDEAVKAIGVSAVGTYAALKVLSAVMDTEMSESAKKFGETLKDIWSGYGEGNKPGFNDLRKVRKAGKEFMEDFKNQQGFSTGGYVIGPGGPKEDKIRANLSPGEYVIQASSVSDIGLDDLNYINKYGDIPKRATGGFAPDPGPYEIKDTLDPFGRKSDLKWILTEGQRKKLKKVTDGLILDEIPKSRDLARDLIPEEYQKYYDFVEEVGKVKASKTNILKEQRKGLPDFHGPHMLSVSTQGFADGGSVLDYYAIKGQEALDATKASGFGLPTKVRFQAEVAKELLKGKAQEALASAKAYGAGVLDKYAPVGQEALDATKASGWGKYGTKVSDTLSKFKGLGSKTAMKGLGKGVLKKLPMLGLILGGVDATRRLFTGDFKGAALETAAAILSTVPGFGTVGSLALTSGLIYHDMNKKSNKGSISGPGGPREDAIPAMVSNGEYIIQSDSAAQLGRQRLDYINKHGELPKFASGGAVGDIPDSDFDASKTTSVRLDEHSINRMTQIMAAELGATFAGYMASRSDQDTEVTSLANRSAKEQELINRLILKNIEATQRATGTSVGNNTRDYKKQIETEEVSSVLDSEKEYEKVKKDLDTITKELNRDFEKMNKEMAELQEKASKMEIASAFEKEIQDIRTVIESNLSAVKFNRDLTSMYKDSFFSRGIPSQDIMSGMFSPKPIEKGKRYYSDLSDEDRTVFDDTKVGVDPTLLQKGFRYLFKKMVPAFDFIKDPVLESFGFTKDGKYLKEASDVFKELEDKTSERDTIKSKLDDFITRKSQLESQEKTVGLSSVEETELDKLNDIIEKLTDEFEELTEDIEKTNLALAPALREQERLSRLRTGVMEQANRMISFGLNNKYNPHLSTNPALKGFPGQISLSPTKSEMSPQQLMFAEADAIVKSIMSSYVFKQQNMQNQVSELEAAKQQALVMEDTISRMWAKESSMVPSPQQKDRIDAYEEKKKEIADMERNLDSTIQAMAKLEPLFRVWEQFTSLLQTTRQELLKVNSEINITNNTAFKKFRETIDNTIGGGGQFSPKYFSLQEEREARMFGSALNLGAEDQFSLEAAKIKQGLYTQSGEQLYNSLNRLRDINSGDEQVRIKQFSEAERQANLFRKKLNPYEAQLSGVENMLMKDDLEPEIRKKLVEYRDALLAMLNNSANLVQNGGQLIDDNFIDTARFYFPEEDKYNEWKDNISQYKGKNVYDIMPEYQSQLGTLAKELGQELQDKISNAADKTAFATALNPIHSELIKHTGLLELIAKERGIADKDISKVLGNKDPLSEATPDAPHDSSFAGWLSKTLSSSLKQKEDSIWGHANGGYISGPGGPKDDKIPAWLSNGEYVIRAHAAKKIGYDKLDELNKYGDLSKFAEGGPVDIDPNTLPYEVFRQIVMNDKRRKAITANLQLNNEAIPNLKMRESYLADLKAGIRSGRLDYIQGYDDLIKAQYSYNNALDVSRELEGQRRDASNVQEQFFAKSKNGRALIEESRRRNSADDRRIVGGRYGSFAGANSVAYHRDTIVPGSLQRSDRRSELENITNDIKMLRDRMLENPDSVLATLGNVGAPLSATLVSDTTVAEFKKKASEEFDAAYIESAKAGFNLDKAIAGGITGDKLEELKTLRMAALARLDAAVKSFDTIGTERTPGAEAIGFDSNTNKEARLKAIKAMAEQLDWYVNKGQQLSELEFTNEGFSDSNFSLQYGRLMRFYKTQFRSLSGIIDNEDMSMAHGDNWEKVLGPKSMLDLSNYSKSKQGVVETVGGSDYSAKTDGFKKQLIAQAKLEEERRNKEETDTRYETGYVLGRTGKARVYDNAQIQTFGDAIQRASGGRVSLPVLHTGGIAQYTGPHILEKGEMVIPKRFSEGGPVAADPLPSSFGSSTSLGLNRQDMDELKTLVKKGLSIKIEDIENKELEVDVKLKGIEEELGKNRIINVGASLDLDMSKLDVLKDYKVEVKTDIDQTDLDSLLNKLTSIQDRTVSVSTKTNKDDLDNLINTIDNIGNKEISVLLKTNVSELDSLVDKLGGVENKDVLVSLKTDTSILDSLNSKIDDVSNRTIKINIDADTAKLDSITDREIKISLNLDSVPKDIDVRANIIGLDELKSITADLSNIKAVGAEKADSQLSQILDTLNSQILDIKYNTDNQITLLNDRMDKAVENKNNLDVLNMSEKFGADITELRVEMNKVGSLISEATNKTTLVRRELGNQITDINNDMNYMKTRLNSLSTLI